MPRPNLPGGWLAPGWAGWLAPGRRRALIIGSGVVVAAAVVIAVIASAAGSGGNGNVSSSTALPPARSGAGPAATGGWNGSTYPPASDPAGSDPGTSDSDASQQASQLDSLLESSTSGRTTLLQALDEISNCDNDDAINDIGSAISARGALLAQAQDANVSALPNGDALKQELTTLLQYSYDSDKAYLAWVQDADGSCPSTSAPSFASVQRYNDKADDAKDAFLADWNPVADQYGLPERDSKTI